MAKKAHKPGAGRKQTYPDSVFAQIIQRYAGGEDLMKILKQRGMPDWGTFWNRVMGPNAVPELLTAHARARESWAEAKVAEAIHIAEKPQVGKKVRVDPDGKKTVTEGDMVEHRRLRVNIRTWFAERVLSRSYGPALRATHQNPDGSPVNVVPVLNITVVAGKPDGGG